MIRSAELADATALHALIRAHAAFERDAAFIAIGELERLIAATATPIHIMVAEDRDGLVGYSAVTFDWSLWRARRYGHLDCLFVAARARGQGIGKRLLDAAIELARAEGVDRLEWQTPSWNEDAIRFYVREGARGTAKMRFAAPIVRDDTPADPS